MDGWMGGGRGEHKKVRRKMLRKWSAGRWVGGCWRSVVMRWCPEGARARNTEVQPKQRQKPLVRHHRASCLSDLTRSLPSVRGANAPSN